MLHMLLTNANCCHPGPGLAVPGLADEDLPQRDLGPGGPGQLPLRPRLQPPQPRPVRRALPAQPRAAPGAVELPTNLREVSKYLQVDVKLGHLCA